MEKTVTYICFCAMVVLSSLRLQAQHTEKLLQDYLDINTEAPVHSISFYFEDAEGKVTTAIAGYRTPKGEKANITDQFKTISEFS